MSCWPWGCQWRTGSGLLSGVGTPMPGQHPPCCVLPRHETATSSDPVSVSASRQPAAVTGLRPRPEVVWLGLRDPREGTPRWEADLPPSLQATQPCNPILQTGKSEAFLDVWAGHLGPHCGHPGKSDPPKCTRRVVHTGPVPAHLRAQHMGGRCHGWPWFTHLQVRRRVEGPVWAASGLTPGSWALTTVLGGPFLLCLSLQGLDPPALRPSLPGPAAGSLGTGLCVLKHGRDAPAPPHSPSPSVVPPPRPRTAVGACSTPNTHTHTLDLTLTQSCRGRGGAAATEQGGGTRGCKQGALPAVSQLLQRVQGLRCGPRASKDILRLDASAAPKTPLEPPAGHTNPGACCPPEARRRTAPNG